MLYPQAVRTDLKYFNRGAYISYARYVVFEEPNTQYLMNSKDYIYKNLIMNSRQLYTTRLYSHTILEGKKVQQTQSLIMTTVCNLVSSINHLVSLKYLLCFIKFTL